MTIIGCRAAAVFPMFHETVQTLEFAAGTVSAGVIISRFLTPLVSRFFQQHTCFLPAAVAVVVVVIVEVNHPMLLI